MTSLCTTVPQFFKTPKIHPPLCILSVMVLVLLTSPVGAQQNARQGKVAGYRHSQKDRQPKPTLKEVVEVCAAFVRKDTDARLKGQASEFDAYVTAHEIGRASCRERV